MIGGYLDGDRKDLKLWRVLSLHNFIAETSEHGTIVAVYDKSAALGSNANLVMSRPAPPPPMAAATQ
jgi:hypothetical protein